MSSASTAPRLLAPRVCFSCGLHFGLDELCRLARQRHVLGFPQLPLVHPLCLPERSHGDRHRGRPSGELLQPALRRAVLLAGDTHHELVCDRGARAVPGGEHRPALSAGAQHAAHRTFGTGVGGVGLVRHDGRTDALPLRHALLRQCDEPVHPHGPRHPGRQARSAGARSLAETLSVVRLGGISDREYGRP